MNPYNFVVFPQFSKKKILKSLNMLKDLFFSDTKINAFEALVYS